MDISRLSVRERMSSSRFPLPNDYFPTVTCSADQHAFFKEKAEQLVSEVAQKAKWTMSHEDFNNGWKLSNSQRHAQETGIYMYSRRRDVRNVNGHRQLEFCCMGKVQMSVEHCLDALYSDNTTDFRSNSLFLMEGALDAVVLNTLETKTEKQPHHYLGLNWMASRSPGLFSKNRDLCYLRSMDTITDSSNKSKIGCLGAQSVDLKQCASLEHVLGLTRDKMSAVLLFKEDEEFHFTNVLWQGSVGLSGYSTSKLVNFLHETFTSLVSNLNQIEEAKYMAQRVEGHKFQRMITSERKQCYICTKKFSLVRTRSQCSVCGENMCKDCEVSSRAKAFNSESFDVPTPTSCRREVALFCKKCVANARRDMNRHSEGKIPRANTSFLLFDNNLLSASVNESDHRLSSAGKTSIQSSNMSTNSSSRLAASLSERLTTRNSKHFNRISLLVGTTMSMSNANEVPISPLAIRTENEKRRSRLETDPMELYDGFDNHKYGVPLATGEYDLQEPMRESFSNHKFTSSDRRVSQGSSDNDMASRLREISQRAQEALEVTKRNSCMMSDTSSAPRVSDLSAFKELDKSIAEQADLLNVIGFVSTGRVYMEKNGSEKGGVRASESSSVMSEDDRFEIIA